MTITFHPNGRIEGINNDNFKLSMPAGTIIQVVESSYSGENTITDTSTPQQIFSGSITPKFSSSRIRVELLIFSYHQNYHDGFVGIFKDSSSTALQGTGSGGKTNASFMVRQGSYENQSNDYQNNPGVFSFLDTAGTTSAITYNVKGYTSNSGYPLYVNRTQSRSQNDSNMPKYRSALTLTEILV